MSPVSQLCSSRPPIVLTPKLCSKYNSPRLGRGRCERSRGTCCSSCAGTGWPAPSWPWSETRRSSPSRGPSTPPLRTRLKQENKLLNECKTNDPNRHFNTEMIKCLQMVAKITSVDWQRRSKRKSILLVLLCKTNDNKDQFKRLVIFIFRQKLQIIDFVFWPEFKVSCFVWSQIVRGSLHINFFRFSFCDLTPKYWRQIIILTKGLNQKNVQHQLLKIVIKWWKKLTI